MRQFKFVGDPDQMFSDLGIDVVNDVVYNEDYEFETRSGFIPLLEVYQKDPTKWELVDDLDIGDQQFMDHVAVLAMRDWDGPVDSHSRLAKFAYDRAYAMYAERRQRLLKK